MENTEIKKNNFWSNMIFYLAIWIKVYPQYILLLILAIPSGIIGVYAEINIPKIIIRGIENKMTIESVLRSILGVSLCMISAKGISSFISVRLMEKGINAKSYLNSDMIFKKLFKLNYQKLIEPETQNKIAKIKEIIGEGDRGTMHQFGKNIVLLLTSFFGIIFFAIDIVKIDVILLVIIIVTATINSLYGIWANKYKSKNIESRSKYAKKAIYIRDLSQKRSFLKDIRIYKMEDWITESFNTYRKKWSTYMLKSENVNFGAVLINALMIFIRDIFVYIYLISKLLNRQIDVSYFVFMVGLVMAFSNWLNEIIIQVNKLISFSVGIDHIRDFLDMDGEDVLIGISPEIESEPEIQFDSVSYRYPGSEHWIFKNFNLKISAGEKLALVGINGAGKTTLMLLLMGLLEPSEGRILINGYDSKEFNKSDYYKLFSPVFQDINIFPETIYSNVAGSLKYDKYKVEKAIYDSGMSAFVDSLQEKGDTLLMKTSREKAIDLSGGQNQRMLLARALYKNGKINILDEPTAALDPIAESEIYEEYNAMSKNKTSVFISHRLASTKFCDRIILLEYGRIIEEGTHYELMEKNGRYREMFEIQSRYYKEGGVLLEG
ncbi:ATP-binding cassette domain-containing protein [Oceanirhabdus sp. W0125-5]|uniref:ATP-binding cassette domain-containing protein n=1 Tax=Oceanirhabdus sp. W0125-5 TaxID=2999116 RepID=UPI0022F2E0C9|nr:ABC transporter ATP-binding protein [Oceanirhabdus sp. W0125-5]WBW98100.1 ABC transporter ATP-binding protein [Oceanirhabdus sp. W0125-5]